MDNQKKHQKSGKKRLTKSDRPKPVNEEVIVPEGEVIISTTDPKGIIIYSNDIFQKISEYTEEELLGVSHNVIRHPDMPKVIFKVLWETIKDKENIMAIVKNLTKSGKYYWVVTDFIPEVDENKQIITYTAYRKPAHRNAIEAMVSLYEKLVEIEAAEGMEASEKYLGAFLQSHNYDSYDEYVEELVIENIEKKALVEELKSAPDKQKSSFFNRFFGVK